MKKIKASFRKLDIFLPSDDREGKAPILLASAEKEYYQYLDQFYRIFRNPIWMTVKEL
jgi:hypothetical protein